MDFFKRAAELQEETVENRRYLHQNAEVGLELPRTKKYIMEKLREYGMEPQECGHGVVAMVGKKTKGKVILLKADMDALPMEERSGLPFACPTGTEAHTCGHDLNSAMLLTAARMLKEQEEELEGRVKIVFEPAEEIFKGGKDMIAAGVCKIQKWTLHCPSTLDRGDLREGISSIKMVRQWHPVMDSELRLPVQGHTVHIHIWQKIL